MKLHMGLPETRSSDIDSRIGTVSVQGCNLALHREIVRILRCLHEVLEVKSSFLDQACVLYSWGVWGFICEKRSFAKEHNGVL